ncbi:hypothetical protein SDC9_166676 [bioreactor metagenome]|uniref:Uncharacterized protein n=1 Tax=bioreactor metagenome TaxID=1076179 RepID=A0A645G0B5_9ZZZZ
MNEGATRGFDDAHTMRLRIMAGVQNIGTEDIWVIQQVFNMLSGIQSFDQAGIVVIKSVFHWFATIEGFEGFELFVGQRSGHLYRVIAAA